MKDENICSGAGKRMEGRPFVEAWDEAYSQTDTQIDILLLVYTSMNDENVCSGAGKGMEGRSSVEFRDEGYPDNKKKHVLVISVSYKLY